MTGTSNDRLDRIEELLWQSIVASDEHMTRLEQAVERDRSCALKVGDARERA